ncbi:Cupin-3 domain-containing protein [Fusarium keratoplasticum]|nr:Cupin-3 domain-containing protein [Fusarium keratoplasticum]
MPASEGNATGSSDPRHVPYGHWDSFSPDPFPEYSGTKSIVYRSGDGKVVVGMLREKGTDTLVWPCDEFLIVTDGWIKVDVKGGDNFILNKGDMMVMQKGQNITFECSDDFANVAVFIDIEGSIKHI